MPNFEEVPHELSEQDREMLEENLWHIKAREKAEEFLSRIDPDLEVDIQESIVTPDDKSKGEYQKTTLLFTHKSNPNIRWTMDIRNDDNWINNDLEGVVRKIYQRQKGK